LLLALAALAVGEDRNSAADMGSFVTLKQSDEGGFRAIIAGPADNKAAVLAVHEYIGISEATKQSVMHFGTLGYRTIAVDLCGGESVTSHEEAVKLMQFLDRKAIDRILQVGLD
jgi:dienelactone hydrolase